MIHENKSDPTSGVERRKDNRIHSMNLTRPLSLILFLMLPFLLGSCEAIAGIFKAGMGFGILLVVAVIIAIVMFFTRMGRNKNT